MITYKQLSLADIFTDCQNKFDNNKYFLYPMLRTLLLQLIFSIPTTSLLIVFLKYSKALRDFCGFDVVPDTSKIYSFQTGFPFGLTSYV